MSIKLMSAIFETEFRDLPMGEDDKNSKASSIKIIMLAIADHANDEGEGSYPGITRLERKTGLSRQGVVDTIKTCKYNGLLSVMDEPSKLGTNDYRINLNCFPLLKDAGQATLLVKPLDYPSQATWPEVVKPLDLNHPLTTNKPLKEKKQEIANSNPEWAILAGLDVSRETQELHALEKAAVDAFENAWGITRPWDWWQPKKVWRELLSFVTEIYRKDPGAFVRYVKWYDERGKFEGGKPAPRIKEDPECFYPAWDMFQRANPPSENTPPHKVYNASEDDDENYVPAPPRKS